MKVLIVGQGGREHALAWKIAQSPRVEQVLVAPGNGGTAHETKTTNINISATDVNGLLDYAKQHAIELTIIGPEAPLVAGIVDAFTDAGLACFGPTQAAAQLESSKAFSKQFMQQHGIPTAGYANFTDLDAALNYAKTQDFPLVIKADGLAAGKGVIIAENLSEAEQAIHSMLGGDAKFGTAGKTIVIEEYLQGEELSFMVICDGKHALPLVTSQDHKRRDDGDRGPNTGGMGAYSPASLAGDELETQIMKTVIQPVLTAMQQAGTPYVGFLYAGLMIDETGDMNVLEFNCRLGDPETQPILMRLQSDLVDLCTAAMQQQLDTVTVQWDPRVALTVVMAAGGYPASYRKGDTITGLNTISSPEVKVFHAGTEINNSSVLTNGGRVLGVTALGNTIQEAQAQAYAALEQIRWPDCFYRQDIGHRALARC